ncbi:GDSL-type esterase/lipase family protein [Hephaestia sp. GCM10023244]|uniref:GDSL-type esterase/lipase family protein n=1 Tax=unclassified Hephaestia TaxID=2631281 RepID=UPI0020771397|nr:GDSL-type esterase/lipase family protein [Hephaestia sp. MAHUQ-44]MCM8730620.1 GDSL-type esterase/lipase family protein [Hephaestia sp. MAHUQ-44]
MRLILLAAAALVTAPAAAQEAPHWVASWGSAQQVPEPHNALPDTALTDATLRQTVRLSLGGTQMRVRFSNIFGTAPLTIDAAAIARPVARGKPQIVPATNVRLSFGGTPTVTIPAGAAYYSDPIRFDAAAGSDVTISIHYPRPPAQQTGHPGSRATSFVVPGNRVGDSDLPDAHAITHWYQLSDIEVAAAPGARAIVAIGDSITDGNGATTDGDNRWPDQLAARLRATGAEIGVVNAGIGGNRVLLDGLGPNLLARFDRDTAARSGATDVILLEGINDLGTLTRDAPVSHAEHDALVANIIAGYRQVIARAHAQGLRVWGGTVTPFVGNDYYHADADNEADRQAINAWIRTPGNFDGVIDFDAAIRDPAHPERLLPAYDSGDHLHPSPAGYAAMAAAVPIEAMIAAGTRTDGPQIAITFDDLPVHGPLPDGDSRIAIMAAISTALKDAGVPPTYGFTNGGFAEAEPASIPALAAWRASGQLLANHGWSHMNLNENALSAWQADVLRNEPAIEPLMAGADWHWLRYPYLAEGETPAKWKAARTFLARHKYKVASVTMSFGDYAWAAPYARCVAKQDQAGIATLEASYMQAAAEALAWSRAASQTVAGREIPLVLLMHVGALDAKLLPRLLAFYRAQGARFVSLAEAGQDAFYAGDIAPAKARHPATFAAAAQAKRVALPPPPSPPALLESICQ